ncbi:hypothetical protein C1645_820693 [Glomus cerebriforme]|uniref:Chromo domain-containing protein n=1 Tax=Glomus cerebriforme TaxID=658196 RepID=A0A397T287_9GLOM|nr:hypothetical protein C1645_820693 [Glomus cerebriforme]
MSALNESLNNGTVDFFEVEAIIGHKVKSDGGIEYLLKWKDFGDEENSWIDEEDTNAPSLIRKYWLNKRNNIVKRRGRPPKSKTNQGQRSSKNIINKQALVLASLPDDNKQESDSITIQETNVLNEEKNTIVNDDDIPMINGDGSNRSDENNVEIPKWLKPINEEGERSNLYFTPYAYADWENYVTILNVVRETNNDASDLFVHIKWPDGTDSYHISSEIYKKCPLKLIQFYEQHLVIKN